MSKENGRRPSYIPELSPTYLDEAEGRVVPVNKYTVAAGDEEREVTVLMRPHTGSDREKDFKLLRFVSILQDDRKQGEGELEVILRHTQEFDEVCMAALDLDDEEGRQKYARITIFEAYEAFQYAMEYRTGGMRDKQVEAAIKKLKGEPEKSPQAEAALPLPESVTTA